MFSEFKPALMFLVKFLSFYIVGNVLYGIFIETYGERADPITEFVTHQTSELLQLVGFDSYHEINSNRPTVFLKQHDNVVVSVFEGCNGVNVMIVFIAFIVAFGGPLKKMIWFISLGIVIVHVSNLIRIALLYCVAIYSPLYFYYFHKFFFTALLYLVIFVLWTIWVVKFNIRPDKGTT
jgi:exosortase family protein XrtF